MARLPRLLFLVTVILGLGWMHTIGSPGHHDGAGNPHVMAAEHMAEPVADMGALAFSHPDGDSGPSLAMCLAILAAAVAVTALLAVRGRRTPTRTPDGHHPAGARHAPPRLIPPGLLIADLTVLRI